MIILGFIKTSIRYNYIRYVRVTFDNNDVTCVLQFIVTHIFLGKIDCDDQ